jgi:hypothetical protein
VPFKYPPSGKFKAGLVKAIENSERFSSPKPSMVGRGIPVSPREEREERAFQEKIKAAKERAAVAHEASTGVYTRAPSPGGLHPDTGRPMRNSGAGSFSEAQQAHAAQGVKLRSDLPMSAAARPNRIPPELKHASPAERVAYHTAQAKMHGDAGNLAQQAQHYEHANSAHEAGVRAEARTERLREQIAKTHGGAAPGALAHGTPESHAAVQRASTHGAPGDGGHAQTAHEKAHLQTQTQTGPRGGQFHIGPSGNKVYESE